MRVEEDPDKQESGMGSPWLDIFCPDPNMVPLACLPDRLSAKLGF